MSTQVVGQVLVIRVEEGEEAPAARSSAVLRAAPMPRFAVRVWTDSRIPRDGIDDAGCAVRAAVIDHDVLPVGAVARTAPSRSRVGEKTAPSRSRLGNTSEGVGERSSRVGERSRVGR